MRERLLKLGADAADYAIEKYVAINGVRQHRLRIDLNSEPRLTHGPEESAVTLAIRDLFPPT
ncbi:MAG: hypothetical protein ACRD5K_19305 [Candidatus Acidiferrales bacterium]